MYWFRRPPYLRWGVGALLIALALVGEFRKAPTVSYPFAAGPLPAGRAITDEVVDWRPVPAGLLPAAELDDRVTARAVRAGEPLVPSLVVSRRAAVPDGWWALPIGLPGRALPGDRVQLVLVPVDPVALPLTVPGMVVEAAAPSDDLFSLAGPTGLVAVPGDQAPAVAQATGEGRVVVALAP
ncbi:MAG: SAF domain-containing protein [Acidimicrobiia bacterium]